MALILTNGVRFTIKGSWDNGRPVHTVWHATMVSGGSRVTSLQESAARLFAGWELNILPLMPNNYSCQVVDYVDLSSTTGTTGEFINTLVIVGGQSLTSLPPSVGALVTKGIADKGRGRRSGRIFLPGGQQSGVDEAGIVAVARQTAIENALGAMLADFNSYTSPDIISQRLVVAHTPSVLVVEERKYRKPADSGTMTASDIVAFDCQELISGIRRRVKG